MKIFVACSNNANAAIATALKTAGYSVTVGELSECTRAVQSFKADLVLVEYSGSRDVLFPCIRNMLLHLSPTPIVAAFGDGIATQEAFELGRIGVRAIIKQISPETIVDLILNFSQRSPEIEAHIRYSIPGTQLQPLLRHVRRLAVDQAIGLAEGNRTRAAQILGVTRQAIQQALR